MLRWTLPTLRWSPLAEMRRDYRIVTFDSDFRFYRMAGRLSFAIINGSA